MLPANTEIKFSDNGFSVKGPLGELSRSLHPNIEIKILDNEVSVHPKKKNIESRALWGTYASHISNMVSGVNKPFEKKLILEGIGFKSEVVDNPLKPGGSSINLSLGFSHPVVMEVPDGLKVVAEKNTITVSGSDKEAVGQFASKLRALKKPEPYKGKGMRYANEIIRRKQGKKSV